MSSDRLDELIAQAAFGELTDAEERELDLLLAADDAAAADLRSTLDVAATIQAGAAETPPPNLRDRVMAATATMAQSPAGEATGTSAWTAPTRPPSSPLASTADVVSLESRRRRRFVSFIGAAAAALVLVVGAAVITSNGDGGGDDPIAAVRDAADVQEHMLTGELEGLRVLYSPSNRALVIHGDDVRSPNGTNDFELWLVGGSSAIPVGVFRPGDDGRVERRFDDIDLTGFVLGVTEEPAGGSDTPTLPILASA